MKPILISIEGLDGVGKTSTIKAIEKDFQHSGLSFKSLHFPYIQDNATSKLIELYLNGGFGVVQEVCPYFISTIFLLNQQEVFHRILNNSTKDVILLDRYYHSTRAYQSALITDPKKRSDFLLFFDRMVESLELKKPDICLYLRVTKKFQVKNLVARDYKDIHEDSLIYQNAVDSEYIELCNAQWHNIQGLNCYDVFLIPYTVEQTLKSIKEVLSSTFLKGV